MQRSSLASRSFADRRRQAPAQLAPAQLHAPPPLTINNVFDSHSCLCRETFILQVKQTLYNLAWRTGPSAALNSEDMQYAALDLAQRQIRLLHLHPGQPEENVGCHFSIISLDSHDTEYEALSYVWGDPTQRRAVHIEGISISVTYNLWQALDGLRYHDRERVIWADALCIDQSNKDERASQVSLMRSIYTQASSVEVWLGDFYDSEVALEFLNDFAAQYPTASYDYLEMDFNTAFKPIDIVTNWKARKALRLRSAMATLAMRPWFDRTWTVQEIFLAKKSTLHCGPHAVDGGVFLQAVDHLAMHHHIGCCAVVLPTEWRAGLYNFFVPVHSLRDFKNYRMDFLTCVANFRSRDATDPRDKIWGLMALDVEGMIKFAPPNYQLTVEQVFESFVLSIIRLTSNLDVFSHLRTDLEQNLELPSFVPDWSLRLTKLHREVGPWSIRYRILDLYGAAHPTEADCKARPGILAIRGIVVDTIVRIASFTLAELRYLGGTPAAWNLVLDELLKVGKVPPKDKDRDLARREAFWMTMCAETMRRFEPIAPEHRSYYPRFSDSYCRIDGIEAALHEDFEHQLRTNHNTQGLNGTLGRPLLDSMNTAMEHAHSGRRFIFTQEGRMGLVPVHAREGDVVAVLTGGHVPIILRTGNGFYTVVGDSFVQGIMDGQAMRDAGKLDYIELH
ncbi:heterokaryon incompatibility protein [Stagonosporopsis vannaccii]|nr:heterokaryon incompatibility protein [Stagonosporopsis vannaccii]